MKYDYNGLINLSLAIVRLTCHDYKRGHVSESFFKRFCYKSPFVMIFNIDPAWLYSVMKRERRLYNEKRNSNK